MSRRSKLSRFARTFVHCLLGAVLASSLACSAKVMPGSTVGSGGATGGTNAGGGGSTGTSGTTGTTGTGGTIVIATDGGSSDAACTPSVTCTPAGGQYCGKIGNGCRGGS